MTDIDIIDGVEGAEYTADLPTLLPALQAFANLVTEAWRLEPVRLHYAAAVPAADPSHWWLVVNSHSPDPSVGGFHDIQPNGLPFARVYAGDAEADGYSASVDLTHELAEMIVDPRIDKTWDDGLGKVYLVEVGDPVEEDGLGFEILGTKCSNFVLPAYYGRSLPSGGPYDYRRVLASPCPALWHGGYVSWLEKSTNQWKQAFARRLDGTQSRRSQRFGRSARRAART